MAGRHRKPNTSAPTAAVAKIAITGAVLGGSGLLSAGHASAATDSEWDQVAAPVADAPESPAPVQAVLVDTMPPPLEPADAPIAIPGDPGLAPAADDQPNVLASRVNPPPLPPSDPSAYPSPDAAPLADAPEPPIDMAAAPPPDQDSATDREALITLVRRFSGTPYIPGGDSPAGTDCSGLASWLANTASGRPTFGDRFSTDTEESALLTRGFEYGTAPGALVIGWNDHHTAVTLADGTPVSSGEGGGIKIGGGGAYQAQFAHHMFLPIAAQGIELVSGQVAAPAEADGMSA